MGVIKKITGWIPRLYRYLRRSASLHRKGVYRTFYFLLFLGFLFGSPAWFFVSAAGLIAFFFLVHRGPDPAVFLGQLMSFLDAGLTLPQALENLKKYHKGQRKRLDRILSDLDNGVPLADSLEKRLLWLPPQAARLLLAGQEDNIITGHIRSYLEYDRQRRVWKKIRRDALLYPAVVFGAGLLMGLFCMIFVLPVYGSMFADFGDHLPRLTQAAIAVADVIGAYWLWVLAALVVIRFVRRRLTGKTYFNRFRYALDAYFLALFIRDQTSQGRQLGEALLSAARIHGNRWYIRAAEPVWRGESEGRTIFKTLSRPRDLPPDLTAALATAAASGRIPETLDQYIYGYSQQFQVGLKRTWSRLAFGAMLFNGLCWGSLVIALYLPIFQTAVTAGP